MIQDFMLSTPNADSQAPGVIVTVRGRSVTFPRVSFDQMVQGHKDYLGGLKVQDAFPFLSPNEREFLMTGMLPEEWEEAFPEDEEDSE
jgi:hypothetical protein